MSLYKQRGSEIWWTNISHDGERIRLSTGELDRQAAQRIHDERKAALWQQPASLKGKTWGNAINKWMEVKDPSLTELLGINKFSAHFPDRMLTAITGEAIEAALLKFCSNPATFNRHRARVVGILKLSRVDVEVPIRKIKEVERDWLTHEQWARLRAELPLHMRHMAEFAITTGLRQANVLGLTWNRVDLTRELVWVDASDTKSGKAIAVPLSIEAINVLTAVQGQHPTFCFTYRGKPVSEIKTAFIAACVRAGVGTVKVAPGEAGSIRSASSGAPKKSGSVRRTYSGFTWHGLRHTWATWHVQNGTPLDVLQKLGGWADYKMVLRYGKHSAGYLATYANNTTKGQPHV